MEANCWNYLCSQLLSAFGSYTAVPIEPGVRDLNLAAGLRPAFITLFTQWVHCFSGLTPEPAWHLAKLPTNYLLTFWNPVCKLCTLRRWELSRPRWFLPCIFRGLLLAGTDDGPFPGPNGRAPVKIHKFCL